MRPLLVALIALLLLPGHVDARRNQRVLVIRDYTSAVWEGVIEQTVADFNAVMPQRAPDLVYARGEGACPQIAPARTIVYCSFPFIPAPSPDSPPPDGVVFNRRTIHLRDLAPDSPWRFNHACHEMMHVLSGVPDKTREDVDSCVWGFTPAPGSVDAALLRKAYRRHR